MKTKPYSQFAIRPMGGTEPQAPNDARPDAMQQSHDDREYIAFLNDAGTHHLSEAEYQMTMDNAEKVQNLSAERASLRLQLEEAQKREEALMNGFRQAMGDAIDGCGMLEAGLLLVSQRDNARGDADHYEEKIAALRAELIAAKGRAKTDAEEALISVCLRRLEGDDMSDEIPFPFCATDDVRRERAEQPPPLKSPPSPN